MRNIKKDRSKKYLHSKEKVEKGKSYPVQEAVEIAKQASYAKFDASLEIHINTPTKNIRGMVSLPFSSGKKLKILAFGKEAQDCGADTIGDDEELQKIEKGKIDFDVLITTPECMPKLSKVAKILGPRGLMPNPKNNTITDNLKRAVTEIHSGKTEYKTEKVAPVIHLSVGKLSQPTEELTQNIKVLLGAIGKSKIKKVVVAPTMGPSIRIDTTTLF